MNIWVKLFNGDKLAASKTFSFAIAPTRVNYEKALNEICCDLDIGTPVSLASHFKHFVEFNTIKYLPRDFIETVNFDFMTLEAF